MAFRYALLPLAKMIGLFFLALLGLGLLGSVLFVYLSPEFGGRATTEEQKAYASADNYSAGKFTNLIPTSMDMDLQTLASVIRDYGRGVPNSVPPVPPPVVPVDSSALVRAPDTLTRITWFGHSAVLLEIDGQRLLLDPMLGDVPAPHPWLGQARFSKKLPITPEELPAIDAVLISHDHYDHLDYGSIRRLKDKVSDFYVPLGVGAHLRRWGVAASAIHELNWWDKAPHGGLDVVFTPARHFSGRGLTDRNATLWGSWVIRGKQDTLYFSGDGGYGPHFAEIGARYGPFDLAMIECGQYDERWAQIHLMPEESAQAAVDLRARRLLPIHWGAFRLALHSWTDPIERVTVKAQELKVPMTTPKIGEAVVVSEENFPHKIWWRDQPN